MLTSRYKKNTSWESNVCCTLTVCHHICSKYLVQLHEIVSSALVRFCSKFLVAVPWVTAQQGEIEMEGEGEREMEREMESWIEVEIEGESRGQSRRQSRLRP